MARRLATTSVRLLPVAVYLVLTAGCGGDASVGVTFPTPPLPPGPEIAGTVLMPNGVVAQVDPSPFRRFAQLLESTASAQFTNLSHVGRNVVVSLTRLFSDGRQSDVLGNSSTNDDGQFHLNLLEQTSADTCRYVLTVGSGATRTRAFVTSGSQPNDVFAASEATVRLILASGNDLCAYSSSEIRHIVDVIVALPELIYCPDVQTCNDNTTIAAASSPVVQSLIAMGGGFTPAPTRTRATETATIAVPTFTPPLPTLTRSPVPSPTPQGPTATTAATNTPPATATATVAAPATDTPTTGVAATATATVAAPATDTPTTGAAATATPTVAAPATDTPTTGVAATPTSTSTTGVAATATPTVTPTTAVAAPTVTPTPSPTTMPSGPVHIVIQPGGGSAGNCRGTCVAGANMGQPCGTNVDCPGSTCGGTRKCAGGGYDGMTCANSLQCNGCDPNRICTAANTPLACCTANQGGTCPLKGSCAVIFGTIPIRVPLNGICLPRSFPPGDVGCSTSAECFTCAGGGNAGKLCTVTTATNDCPGGTCTGPGTCQLASLEVIPGSEDGNHERTLTIPQSSLMLNPALVPNIGTVCVNAGGNGVGVADCDGGRSNIDSAISRDHNTTPQVCLGGTKVGQACTKNTNCPGGTCFNGTNPGVSCSTNADCTGGGICAAGCNLANSGSAGGLPDDPMCTNTFVLPNAPTSYACLEGTKACNGGPNEGARCTMDSECPTASCSFCNIATNGLGGPATGGPHPNVCNSPNQVQLSGTFGAGDVVITLPLSLTVEAAPAPTPPADYGPDHLPCTADDTASPSPPVTVLLSTGTNTINIFDFANVNGSKLQALIKGQGLMCTDLIGGNVTGLQLGGGFSAIDGPTGDIATVFQFTAQ